MLLDVFDSNDINAGGLDCYQQPTPPNEFSIQTLCAISATQTFPFPPSKKKII